MDDEYILICPPFSQLQGIRAIDGINLIQVLITTAQASNHQNQGAIIPQFGNKTAGSQEMNSLFHFDGGFRGCMNANTDLDLKLSAYPFPVQ